MIQPRAWFVALALAGLALPAMAQRAPPPVAPSTPTAPTILAKPPVRLKAPVTSPALPESLKGKIWVPANPGSGPGTISTSALAAVISENERKQKLAAATTDLTGKGCTLLAGRNDEFNCRAVAPYQQCVVYLKAGIATDCQAEYWDDNGGAGLPIKSAIVAGPTNASSNASIIIRKDHRGAGIAGGKMTYSISIAPPKLDPPPVSVCDPRAADALKNAPTHPTCQRVCQGKNKFWQQRTGDAGGIFAIGADVACDAANTGEVEPDPLDLWRAYNRCDRDNAWGGETVLREPWQIGFLFRMNEPKGVYVNSSNFTYSAETQVYRWMRMVDFEIKVLCLK